MADSRGDLLNYLEQYDFDAVLISTALSDTRKRDISGLDVLKLIRNQARGKIKTIPVVVIDNDTTLTINPDKSLSHFNAGADSYISQTEDNRHILAQVNAIVLRSRGNSVSTLLRTGPFELDLNTETFAIYDGGKKNDVPIGPQEFLILRVLFLDMGKVLPYERIYNAMYPDVDSMPDSHKDILKVRLSELRKKIAGHVHDHLIETVPGRGLFVPKKDSEGPRLDTAEEISCMTADVAAYRKRLMGIMREKSEALSEVRSAEDALLKLKKQHLTIQAKIKNTQNEVQGKDNMLKARIAMARGRLVFRNLEINLEKRMCKINGQPVRLPPLSLRFLAALVSNKDRILTESELLNLVYPGKGMQRSEGLVRAQVCILREALRDSVKIENIRGGKYIIRDEDALTHKCQFNLPKRGGLLALEFRRKTVVLSTRGPDAPRTRKEAIIKAGVGRTYYFRVAAQP